jgi:preprotein translocase subunit SecD
VEERSIGASLGADAIRRGLIAAAVGALGWFCLCLFTTVLVVC